MEHNFIFSKNEKGKVIKDKFKHCSRCNLMKWAKDRFTCKQYLIYRELPRKDAEEYERTLKGGIMYTLENGTILLLEKITVIVPFDDPKDTGTVAIIGIDGNRIGVNQKDLDYIKNYLKNNNSSMDKVS